jgi:hypothetical protein
MKYCLVLSVILLASCSNPSLKWIGAPEDSAAGLSEIFLKIKDPDLLPQSPANDKAYDSAGTVIPDVVEVKVNLYKTNSLNAGSAAPYDDPQWRLDGDLCDVSTGQFSEFTEKPYWVSPDKNTIWIDTASLAPGVHEVEVIVTGTDNNHYSDSVEVLVDAR